MERKRTTETTSRTYGGRYAVRSELGRGGMAAVYLAHDLELDRPVALKVLPGSTADEEFLHRFRREAQTAARLAHPNIVHVFDTGEDDGELFIVMEYVEGESLAELLAREERIEPTRALELADQACAALAYAHSQGVVHRDVKPANILLRTDGVLKVADFGIASAADATALTQAGTLLGTASYVAPEQARGVKAGPQADVFSLGVVLYEVLTGKLPWKIKGLADLPTIGATPARPVRDLAPDVPAPAAAAVMRALATDPRDRPADAGQLGRELGREPMPTAVTALLEPSRPLRSFRARRLLGPAVVLLVAVVLGIVAGVALLGGDDGGRPAQQPAQVEQVPTSDDALELSRNLAEWLREHTG